uniref:Reverse transcriptase Ty1/copia-type domain-containing protein n=1 Tax=Amphimedon queenslandica TaxID=400682 RepID=A0A1X7SLL6_AMPQE
MSQGNSCDSCKVNSTLRKGTMDVGLKYERFGSNEVLIGFSDADLPGDTDSRRSTTGNLFVMSGEAVSWLNRKQSLVALSTTEAEYVALASATQEAVCLGRLLSNISMKPKAPIVINEDNQGTIAITKNPTSHIRMKHINIKFHYDWKVLQDGIIELVYCPTDPMTADILTKPLPQGHFEAHSFNLGLRNLPTTKLISVGVM